MDLDFSSVIFKFIAAEVHGQSRSSLTGIDGSGKSGEIDNLVHDGFPVVVADESTVALGELTFCVIVWSRRSDALDPVLRHACCVRKVEFTTGIEKKLGAEGRGDGRDSGRGCVMKHEVGLIIIREVGQHELELDFAGTDWDANVPFMKV